MAYSGGSSLQAEESGAVGVWLVTVVIESSTDVIFREAKDP
jgi:hypothetical protein